jgi:trimethylamine--corrinoid protein Co-methyltransferase
MIQSLSVAKRSVFLRVLTEDQIAEIQHAALDVLQSTGCKVLHAGARQMLQEAGAVVKGEHVRIPRHIVEAAIRSAPKGFTIYNREGERAMEIEGRKSYYGTSTASPRTRDVYSGEIRETRVADIALGARVADALPNIDWVMPMGSSQDVPALAADVHEFEAVVSNTVKPIVFIGYSPQGVEAVYEMAAEVAGGLDNLQARPFLLLYPEPISPLIYPEEVVDRLFVAADLGLPQIPGPAVQPGGTGPVTLAGAVVQLIAESLVGVVLIQLRKLGAPCFLGGNIGVLDMATTNMSIAAPETSLALAAYAEVAQAWGLPTWGLAGATDAKTLDAQAGIESAFATLAQGLAGLNLIHDVGYLDMGMVCSAEMLVMGDEVIEMTKRFIAGMEVTAETLARGVIDRVGPGGNFLADKHTVQWFREELWRPRLLTRQNYATWQDGGAKDMAQRVQERLVELVETHQVRPLAEETVAALERIKRERQEQVK